MSKLYNALEEAFETEFYKAVRSKENRNEDGSIIWNFVDADISIELHKKFGNIPDDLYCNLFDSYAEALAYEEAA